jgi:hypothetical protein
VVKNELGNEVLRISFSEPMWQRLLFSSSSSPVTVTATAAASSSSSSSSYRTGNTTSDTGNVTGTGTGASSEEEEEEEEERSAYGVQYDFALRDDAAAAAVNAPEWLVPQGRPLRALAARHGMVLQTAQNFGDFVYEYMEGKSDRYSTHANHRLLRRLLERP